MEPERGRNGALLKKAENATFGVLGQGFGALVLESLVLGIGLGVFGYGV